MKKNRDRERIELKGIARSVNLQLLIGAAILMIPHASERVPEFMKQTTFAGGILIFMGINTGIYLTRYRKVLDNNASKRTASTRSA